MKNNLEALNDHLFDLLEQVTDDTDQDGNTLDPEAVKTRIARIGAGTGVAREIINVHRLALDAERLRVDMPGARIPKVLGIEDDDNPALPKLRQVRS